MAVTKQHIDLVLEQAAGEGKPVLQVAPAKVQAKGIPAEWAGVLSSSEARQTVLKALWEPIAHRVPKVMREMKRTLQGVGLLTTNARPPSLVYFFTTEDDEEPHYYRGFVPLARPPKQARELPEEFLQFYQVHDGWVNPFMFMGPLPSRDWQFLGTEAPSNKFLTVFMGNGGELIGYDLRESPPLCYLLPSGDDPPEVLPNIWARINRWVATQMEDSVSYKPR